MSPSCGCTCPHHTYAPMTAQEMAVWSLVLLAFLTLIPAFLGLHFWMRATLFPGKMLIAPKSSVQPVFVFRRRGLSRLGALLTLPFLLNVLAVLVWSRPSAHQWDTALLWLIFIAWPIGAYTVYGIYTALKCLGRDELRLDVGQGVYHHKTGLPGLEKTRTGPIWSLGQLEIKSISVGQRTGWLVRFHKAKSSVRGNTATINNLLGGFDNRQDAEQLCEQVRLSRENRRIVFPFGIAGKEGWHFVYSPGEATLSEPDILAPDRSAEHIEPARPPEQADGSLLQI